MRITDHDRRARLVAHQLDLGVTGPQPVTTVEGVVDRLVALHATDAPSVHLSVLARVPGLRVEDVQAALYERRSLVRVLAMRRTLFVVARDLVPVVHAGASAAVGRRLRARLPKELATLPTDPPVEDAETFLAGAEEQVHDALAQHGPLTGAQLPAQAPVLRTAFLPTTTRSWDVRRSLTSPLLSLLSAEGRIVRGEPTGGWSSNRFLWRPVEDWLPGGIPDADEAEARVRLASAWLESFGPATVADLRWWTGWNLGQTRAALAALDVREVELDGLGAGVALRSSDLAPAPGAAAGHVALLPSLDPTAMGWKHRDWYLGPHREQLFDTAGNIGATVWWEGRIVGAWAVRTDGSPAVRLLEDIGSDGAAAVDAEAERITGLLDGGGVTASFPTPLYRELRG
ncbi:winged helix DNA-binding domain-containing protein [Oerskovia turbata]|uniref:Winged helix DNA-binding domain-containing protein n=1 Tax=Oerskovia turbata TaxID=1713 RepID=A0A4Q1L0H7_9CELL|nr:winged helix DNA-binding domain-containing protein [Oerskovia turbata]RXR26929.1 winged helix DNA-binding domain-containing protein [Oerskovia turbata]RXR36229.1 winged helix DNA-binding domain-containing protein [Oerskovia turbata]